MCVCKNSLILYKGWSFCDIRMPEISLLPVFLKKANGRRIVILLPVSIFTWLSSAICYFASAHQILSNSDHLGDSYGVISIFQDGCHCVANQLPVAGLRRPKYICKPIFISNTHFRCLNLLRSYYYFCFLNTNSHHIRILVLSVPIHMAKTWDCVPYLQCKWIISCVGWL